MKEILLEEMERRGVSVQAMAEALGMHRNSVANKLYGKTRFSVDEAILLSERFFPDCEIRVLFRDEAR